MAWCGTDGSLLAPVTLAQSEAFPAIQRDLDPLVDRMRRVRAQAGFPSERCVPVFHATDSYEKHRVKLRNYYNDKFADLGVVASYATPRAQADDCLVMRKDMTVGPE